MKQPLEIGVPPLLLEHDSRILDERHQLALRSRPAGRSLMHHYWRDLLFLHFPIEPDELGPVVPGGLQLDLFPDEEGREMAWIGLVCFSIDYVRFWNRIRVPTASSFLETNVRTYVHRGGQRPAVLFLSLDAESRLACAAARLTFGLPYWHAGLSLDRDGLSISYRGRRKNGTASYEISADLTGPAFEAVPGTLEFFLGERYLLYAERRGAVVSCQVHHPPYQLHPARCTSCEQNLTRALGIGPRPIAHAMFCEGVATEVFPPLT